MSFWDKLKKRAIKDDPTVADDLIDALNNQSQSLFLASTQLIIAQSLLQNQLKTPFERFKEVHETSDLGFEIKTALIYVTTSISEYEDALCFLKRDCEGKNSFAWYNPNNFDLSIQMTFELESDLVMFKLKFANEANSIRTLNEENQQ